MKDHPELLIHLHLKVINTGLIVIPFRMLKRRKNKKTRKMRMKKNMQVKRKVLNLIVMMGLTMEMKVTMKKKTQSLKMKMTMNQMKKGKRILTKKINKQNKELLKLTHFRRLMKRMQDLVIQMIVKYNPIFSHNLLYSQTKRSWVNIPQLMMKSQWIKLYCIISILQCPCLRQLKRTSIGMH